MGIFERLRTIWQRHSRARAERAALRVLMARKDKHLLRDAGLTMFEDREGAGRCEPLPQMKERRWTAPVIRLSPPILHERIEGDAASAPSNKKPVRDGKALGAFPSPRLQGEGGRQAG